MSSGLGYVPGFPRSLMLRRQYNGGVRPAVRPRSRSRSRSRARSPSIRTQYTMSPNLLNSTPRGIAKSLIGSPLQFLSAVGSQVDLPLEVSPDAEVRLVLVRDPSLLVRSERLSLVPSVLSVSSSVVPVSSPTTSSVSPRSPVAESHSSDDVALWSLAIARRATAGPSPPTSPSSCECNTE